MPEGLEGLGLPKRTTREEAGASCPMTGLGRASLTSCPNEVQVGRRGDPCHGTVRPQRSPVAEQQEEGADRRRAAKGVLGVQSDIMADGWEALVDLRMARSHR